uniref:Putative family 17 glucosidase SCW4 n=1 Tax=Talaromyces marneffei PM1 TaxID=1077442 RepID=A0A093VB11_TALMA
MKYWFLGIAALALLHPTDGHVHHHHQLSKRALRHEGAAQPCPKATLTNTVIVQLDQAGHTVDVRVQSARPSVHREVSTSSVSSPKTRTSASSTSKIAQSNRHIIPQPSALSHLPDPLDLNLLHDPSIPFFGKRSNYGISYSPYKADSTCKNQDEVSNEIKKLRQFSFVRFYGIDCDQAETVTNAARQNDMRVFAGLYNIDDIERDLKKIIEAADGDWSTFHTVSIGNELVNRGAKSPEEVVGAVNSARTILRRAGYQGPVVTVDTFNQMIAHPELCDESDYCAANCHAFFDSNQTPENAGPYVLEQARHVSQATKHGNKPVLITETGWPSAGEPNGNAVPSRHNQMIAFKSLRRSFPQGGVVFFSAFDDKWKQDNAWTFDTEKHWGLYGLAKSVGGFPHLIGSLEDEA